MRDDLDRCRSESFTRCLHQNLSRLRRRANDDAVHAILNREAAGENIVVLALGDPAAPFGGTSQREVDQIQSRRASLTFSINNFDINKRDICTVGAQAAYHRLWSQADSS